MSAQAPVPLDYLARGAEVANTAGPVRRVLATIAGILVAAGSGRCIWETVRMGALWVDEAGSGCGTVRLAIQLNLIHEMPLWLLAGGALLALTRWHRGWFRVMRPVYFTSLAAWGTVTLWVWFIR